MADVWEAEEHDEDDGNDAEEKEEDLPDPEQLFLPFAGVEGEHDVAP